MLYFLKVLPFYLVEQLNHKPKYRSKKNSIVIFMGVVGFHLLVVIAFQRASNHTEFFPEQTLLQLITLPVQQSLSLPVLQEPVIGAIFYNAPSSLVPPNLNDVTFENVDLHVDISLTDTPYELHSKSAELYKDVFNPELRKKLQENHKLQAKRKTKKPQSWTDIYGVSVVELGDGNCLVGSSTANAHKVKCGKDEGEKMMDNINADLEARLHPLNE